MLYSNSFVLYIFGLALDCRKQIFSCQNMYVEARSSDLLSIQVLNGQMHVGIQHSTLRKDDTKSEHIPQFKESPIRTVSSGGSLALPSSAWGLQVAWVYKAI